VVDKVLFSSDVTTWGTPKWLFDVLHKKHKFSVDVAANRKNTKLPRWWGPKSPEGVKDSLVHDWSGERCWLNSPYGRGITGKWVKKAYEESLKPGTMVALLLPSRSDQPWWRYVLKASMIIFVKGRIKFDGAKHGAPFPSVICIFDGECNVPVIKIWDISKTRKRKKKAA